MVGCVTSFCYTISAMTSLYADIAKWRIEIDLILIFRKMKKGCVILKTNRNRATIIWILQEFTRL